jgi:hypothetical protein
MNPSRKPAIFLELLITPSSRNVIIKIFESKHVTNIRLLGIFEYLNSDGIELDKEREL